jgi:tetratricopeptide (TPR) repeat protein
LAKAVALAPKASEGERKLIEAVNTNITETDAVKVNRLFTELAARFPKDKRIQWYAAQTFGALEEYDQEIAGLEKAIALDKGFAPPYETLGYVHRWRERFDKAERCFKEYGRLSPGEANSHDILGDLYQKMGRLEESVKHYDQAVKMDPKFSYSGRKAGISLAWLGKYDEGRKAILKAMDMEALPANKVYDQRAVARTYIYEGDYAKALEAQDKVVLMAKEFGLPEEESYAFIVKGAISSQAKKFEDAIGYLSEFRRSLDRIDIPAAWKDVQRVEESLWQAVVAAGRSDFLRAQEEAEGYAQKIKALNNPAAMKYPDWLRGYIAFFQGDAAKAIAFFSKGEMNDPYFMFCFAAAKEKAGDAAGAKVLYKKIADWNLDSEVYAFVRTKAITKVGSR